ncbi:aminodeoxychorismate lyase [Paenibacillus hamazuiensis]|uniref:aminodeoxychorismate lyase n=1 Tax=Paenibacillus hamazuiensis TaxID=2936508 RepID=UPI00200F1E56
MILYWNDKFIDEKKAVVSVYDHGFLYGIGLFETFRTYGGQPFLLERHAERLTGGCRELGIAYEPQIPAISGIVSELLRANGLDDAYFRWTVSAGEGILGLPNGDYENPTVILYVKPLPPRPTELDQAGKPLQRLALRRNSPEGAVRLKSFHYMNSILGKRELGCYPWASSRAAEGLFLDADGHIAEGIVSNLFFARDGVVYTPSLETGILPGITRGFVMELAKQAGYRLKEGLYTWEELTEADEIWMTNSIQEIVPVTTLFDIDGKSVAIGGGQAGPVTADLLRIYREHAAGCEGFSPNKDERSVDR